MDGQVHIGVARRVGLGWWASPWEQNSDALASCTGQAVCQNRAYTMNHFPFHSLPGHASETTINTNIPLLKKLSLQA